MLQKIIKSEEQLIEEAIFKTFLLDTQGGNYNGEIDFKKYEELIHKLGIDDIVYWGLNDIQKEFLNERLENKEIGYVIKIANLFRSFLRDIRSKEYLKSRPKLFEEIDLEKYQELIPILGINKISRDISTPPRVQVVKHGSYYYYIYADIPSKYTDVLPKEISDIGNIIYVNPFKLNLNKKYKKQISGWEKLN